MEECDGLSPAEPSPSSSMTGEKYLEWNPVNFRSTFALTLLPSSRRRRAMAAVLGNAALFLDLASHRGAAAVPDRKPRLAPVLTRLDPVLLQSLKRDLSFETEPARRERTVAVRGKASGDGFESEEDGNGGGREEWEAELKRRVKEIEEMKELEKKAEELQSRAMEEGDGDDGATEEKSEEEKRMRVRKELEKV